LGAFFVGGTKKVPKTTLPRRPSSGLQAVATRARVRQVSQMPRTSRAKLPACRAAIMSPTWRIRAGFKGGAPGTSRPRNVARNVEMGRMTTFHSCPNGANSAWYLMVSKQCRSSGSACSVVLRHALRSRSGRHLACSARYPQLIEPILSLPRAKPSHSVMSCAWPRQMTSWPGGGSVRRPI